MKNIYVLAFGVLMTIAMLGCSQSSEGSGDQTSRVQTATTQGETTVHSTSRKETTVEQKTPSGEGTTVAQGNAEQQENDAQRNNAQQGQVGGQVEITMNAPPGQQNQQPQQQGQQPREPVTVRISGTEGLAFTGRVGSSQGLKRVKGSLPAKYEVSFAGAAVTAAIRKQEPREGTIKVEVVREGRVVASQESASTTGVVNLVWAPQ